MDLPSELGVSQLLPCRRRRTDLGTYALASLPSSDLVVGGATRAHPGLPQGERARAAGMIAATVPIHSRGGGARHRAALHGAGAGLQQGSNAAAESCSVDGWAYAVLHYT